MSVSELFYPNSYNLYCHDLTLSGDLSLDDVICHTLKATSTENATSVTTGSCVVSGGMGIAKDLYIGGDLNLVGDLTLDDVICHTLNITSTIDSSSTSTGGLVCAGGVGIAKTASINKLNVYNGSAVVNGTQYNSSVSFVASYYSDINADSSDGSSIGTSAGTVAITGNWLDTHSNGGVLYETSGNVDFTQEGTVKFMYKPDYNTAPSNNVYLFIVEESGTNNNKIFLQHQTSGQLNLVVFDSSGTVVVGSGAPYGVWTCVQGQAYEIEANFNITLGTTCIFIDGVKLGNTQLGTGTRTNSCNSFGVAGGLLTINYALGYFKNLIVYNTIQHTSAYTPGYSVNNALTVYGASDLQNVVASNIDCLNLTIQNTVKFDSTTESTSVSTGCFICSGGVGIAKNLNIGGVSKIFVTTEASSTSTGSLQVLGGAGIAKNLCIGGSNTVYVTTESSSSSTGSLIVLGGAGLAKNLNVGGSNTIHVTTEATSTSTGSMICLGGAGIAKNLHVGGTIVNPSTSTNLTVSPSGWFAGDHLPIRYQKMGDFTFLDIPSITGTTTSSTYFIGGSLPVLPTHPLLFPCSVVNDGTEYIGQLILQTNGAITVKKSIADANFSANKAITLWGFSCVYPF